MFFAVVRFSSPSQETEAAKRKAKAKNNSPDPQEPIFNLLVAAKGRSPRPRQVDLCENGCGVLLHLASCQECDGNADYDCSLFHSEIVHGANVNAGQSEGWAVLFSTSTPCSVVLSTDIMCV